MKRHLFTVAAILSCLMAVGAATSWVRSYFVYDQLSCGSSSDGYRCKWKPYGANYQFPRWPPGIPEGASHGVLVCCGKVLLEQAVYSDEPVPAMALRGYGWSSDANVIPGFSYFHAVTGDMTRKGHWTVRQVTFQHWAAVLIFAMLPTAWLIARRRRGQWAEA